MALSGRLRCQTITVIQLFGKTSLSFSWGEYWRKRAAEADFVYTRHQERLTASLTEVWYASRSEMSGALLLR
jgi:hypothetical protein